MDWLTEMGNRSLPAQVTDPISGGAGWVGAGLLGLVLAWLLLKHLPDKDKQINNLVERHLTIEEKQRHDHEEWLIRQRDDFRSMLGDMLNHNETQIEAMTKAMSADLQALRQVVDSLHDLIESQERRSHG